MVLIKNKDDNTDADDNNKEHVTKTIQSIRIQNDINSDNIQATLNNGLLIITLPRVNDGSAKEAKIIPRLTEILIITLYAKLYRICGILSRVPRLYRSTT